MSLSELTKPMHHACEKHPVGQRMFQAKISPQEWADWLWAFNALHGVIDRDLEPSMCRKAQLHIDLMHLPAANPSPAALRFAADLCGVETVGASYVLHGAHRSGGRVMAPILTKVGLPCLHVQYPDQGAAQAWVKWAREQTKFATQAILTFECLLAVMDEINARSKNEP